MQKRALAGAGFSNDGNHLAALDGQLQGIEQDERFRAAAILLTQILDAQERRRFRVFFAGRDAQGIPHRL